MVCASVAFADIGVITLSNGANFLNSTGENLFSCTTSDGGEAVVEYDFNVSGRPSIFYYKLNSNYAITTPKTLVYTFEENQKSLASALGCDGTDAYLISSLGNGTSVNYSGKVYAVNLSNYTTLQVMRIDSSGNVVFLNETPKEYTIGKIDIVVDSYIQAVFTSFDDPYDNITEDSYNASKLDLKYIRLDKSNGGYLNEQVIFSDFYGQASIIGDGSDNVYMIYGNLTINPAYNSDVYFCKLDSNGGISVGPVKLNEREVYVTAYDYLNDIVIDSTGDIHAIWTELDEDLYWQIRYSKLNNGGNIIINKTLTNNFLDGLDTSLFLEMGDNDFMNIYYELRSFLVYVDGSRYDSKIKWVNMSNNGVVVDNATVLDGYLLLSLGLGGCKINPVSGDYCCGACTGDPINLREGESVPEFSYIGILLTLITVIVGLFIIIKYKLGGMRK